MFINFILPRFHIGIESWKFNKNYNIYVSNYGNFLDKNKEKIKPNVNMDGYLYIGLCNNKHNKEKFIPAHRIVMETWKPRSDMWTNKLTVDHLDHNKRNNNYKNLEWVSLEENLSRANQDYITLHKDRKIQSLEDRVKSQQKKIYNLQDKILKSNIIEIKGDTFSFRNWDEVKSYLSSISPTVKSINTQILAERIIKASKNKTKYCNYMWKIKYKEV